MLAREEDADRDTPRAEALLDLAVTPLRSCRREEVPRRPAWPRVELASAAAATSTSS